VAGAAADTDAWLAQHGLCWRRGIGHHRRDSGTTERPALPAPGGPPCRDRDSPVIVAAVIFPCGRWTIRRGPEVHPNRIKDSGEDGGTLL
jgi:hypothetical protein